MNRKPIQEIRRRELIEAAYRVFLVHGLAGLTTAKICKEAGMSPGLLVYYFKSKDDVLFWMVRHANNVLMNVVSQKMKAATNRWDRLMAIVVGNFPEDLFNRNTANAWLSFYALSVHDKQLERLQSVFNQRLTSNVHSCVNGILAGTELTDFSRGLGILIDGCWLRKGGSLNNMTCVEAIAFVENQAVFMLGAAKVEQLKSLS